MENAGNARGLAGHSDVYKEAIGGFYRTILACAAGTIVLLSLAFWGWKSIPDGTVGQQEWVAYLGIIFATAVALAGSLVAIMLASRSLDSAKAQSELAEQANRIAQAQSTLSDQANQIAERQSTESMLAVEGTAHYQRFKSMLITMPALLRRGQRDRVFDDRAGIALLEQMVQIMGGAIDTFLASNVPATAVALAKTIEARHARSAPAAPPAQEQRYFEFAASSLQYDLAAIRVVLALPPAQRGHLNLRLLSMRLLHAVYALVRELDRLFLHVQSIGQLNEEEGFTLLQRTFIRHVAPVAALNGKLNLREDFESFARQIWGEEKGIIPAAGALREVPAHMVNQGGLVIALHDAGFSEALADIRRHLASLDRVGQVVRIDDGGWVAEADRVADGVVPIFFITEQFDDRLLQVHRFLAPETASRWPQRIVILDQVEQPSAGSVFENYLSFDDQLACWRYFAAADIVLARGRQLAGWPGNRADADDVMKLARGDIGAGLDPAVWDDILVRKREQVTAMIARAAASQEDAPADPRRHAEAVLDLCATLIDEVRAPALDPATAQAFPSFNLHDPDYAGLDATVQLLAKPPLMERPLFHLPDCERGIVDAGRCIDLDLPNTAVFGVAYLNSTFKLPRPTLVRLLSDKIAYRVF